MQTGLAFIGPAYFLDNESVAASESINYYLEVTGNEGRTPVALRGTPGLKSAITGLDGKIRGTNEFDGLMYAVAGNKFYTIDVDETATSKGDIDGNWRAYLEYNKGNQIVISDAPVAFLDGYFIFPGRVTIAYIYDIAAGTLTQIADTDFDTSGDGTFFISAINDGTAYDALDFAKPETYPDDVIACFTLRRQLVLFGTKTIEFWFNSGASAFPFSRQNGTGDEHGAISAASIVKGNNTLYWVAEDQTAYMIQGFTAIPLSTAPFNEALQGYVDSTQCEGFYHVYRGHKFIAWNFTLDDETWVYDATLPATFGWHKRRSFKNGPWQPSNKGRWRASTATRVYNKTYIGDSDSGNIWEMDGNTFDENGDVLEAVRIGNYLHADNRHITISNLEFLMKAGVGLVSGQGVNPKAQVSVSKDDGQTYANERWVNIGKQGTHNRKVRLRNFASNRGSISTKLVITDPVNRDIVGVVGDVKVGR